MAFKRSAVRSRLAPPVFVLSEGLLGEQSEKTKTATAKRSEAGLTPRIVIAQNFALADISGVELFSINAFLLLIQFINK